MRIVHTREFDAVYETGVRASAGPLVVWGAPNDLGHSRLGLAVSRRAGSAAVRNRIKRMIRESFRLLRDDLPGGVREYDLVVGVRRHEPLEQKAYEEALLEAARAVDRSWSKRNDKTSART